MSETKKKPKQKPKAKKAKVVVREDIAGLWVILVRGEFEFVLTPRPFTRVADKERVRELVESL